MFSQSCFLVLVRSHFFSFPLTIQAIQDPAGPAHAVDAVTKELVMSAAKTLDPKKENFSMAAIGGTSTVPYLNDIFVG